MVSNQILEVANGSLDFVSSEHHLRTLSVVIIPWPSTIDLDIEDKQVCFRLSLYHHISLGCFEACAVAERFLGQCYPSIGTGHLHHTTLMFVSRSLVPPRFWNL